MVIILFANPNEVHKQIVVVSSELMLSIAAHYSISSVGTVSHNQCHIYAKHGCQPHRLIGCYYHYARRKCAKLMNAASRRLECWQPPNDEVLSTCKLWCNYYLQQSTLSRSHTVENDGVETSLQKHNHTASVPLLWFYLLMCNKVHRATLEFYSAWIHSGAEFRSSEKRGLFGIRFANTVLNSSNRI